ncbi:MAG: hypothetical protein OQJ81_10625, partial [Melioribacteraceae bacterium]|nr:hypothetical protein [Melioribacteraceae bacterium]
MKYIFKKIALLLIILGVSTNIISQNGKYEERVQSLLNKIENYEYNQDGSPLYDLDKIIKNAMNENENLDFLEGELIKSLLANSTYDAKLFICRQLSLIGTHSSVTPLISLISDSHYSDIVRIALEKINSTEVDNGLLKVIEKVDDEIKRGIIATLAARKSYSSISTISEYVLSDDIELATIAASALGYIGGVESVEKIKSLLNKVTDDVKKVLFDSYLKCGDEFLALNKIEMANEVYTYVLDNSDFTSIKYAALKGLINSAHENRGLLILNLIKDNNIELAEVAMSQIE